MPDSMTDGKMGYRIYVAGVERLRVRLEASVDKAPDDRKEGGE